jgi:hypothetical protein
VLVGDSTVSTLEAAAESFEQEITEASDNLPDWLVDSLRTEDKTEKVVDTVVSVETPKKTKPKKTKKAQPSEKDTNKGTDTP